jgi:hypothetical protein
MQLNILLHCQRTANFLYGSHLWSVATECSRLTKDLTRLRLQRPLDRDIKLNTCLEYKVKFKISPVLFN